MAFYNNIERVLTVSRDPRIVQSFTSQTSVMTVSAQKYSRYL